MRISDWSSDVCSSDLLSGKVRPALRHGGEGTQQGGDPRRLRAPPAERSGGGTRHRPRRDRKDRPPAPEGAAAMSLASEPLAGAGAWIKAMVDGWAGYSADEDTLTQNGRAQCGERG